MRYIGCGLIGIACKLLQPEQPQSLIATVLLCAAAAFIKYDKD